MKESSLGTVLSVAHEKTAIRKMCQVNVGNLQNSSH
jgi:hypothetical protein